MNALDVEAIQNLLLAATLALPRTMTCLLLVPVFSPGGAVPRTLRIAIALGLSWPAAAGVADAMQDIGASVPVVAIVLKETVIGLVLGTVLAAPFWAIESAGALLDQQRGANSGQQVTPFSEANSSITGAALKQALIIVLATTGGVSVFYQLLLASFDAWPVLSLVPSFTNDTAMQVAAKFSEMVRLGLLYAAPFIIVLGVIDFSFALLGVAAPSLQSYFAAMPIKCLAGLFVLIVYLSVFLQHGQDHFQRAIEFSQALFSQSSGRK